MPEIKYSIVESSRADEVSELLLRSFFIEEPLGVALGLTIPEVTRWLPAHIKSALEHGVSIVATVDEDGEEDKIVGVSVNVLKTPEQECPNILSYLDPELEPNMWQVARFLSLLNEDLDLSPTFVDGKEPEKTMLCLFLNVDKSYAGCGIGKTLAIKSEELATEKGVTVLQVDTTSEFSYKVYTTLGYKAIRSVPFEGFTDENGKKLINEEEMGVHQFGRVLVKLINNKNENDN